VHLEDIRSASPAPSSRQGAVAERASNEEMRPSVAQMVVGKAEKTARLRIQVRKDWTVSTESYVGMDPHERSFMK
jgi:hypothetical protein